MNWDFKWKFWYWFFWGLKTRSGFEKLLLNWWLFLHVSIGVGLALWIELPLHEAAQSILLPLAGILIGLTFAWSGNAQALIQKNEIKKLASHHLDGIEVYVYTFQSVILVILVTLVAWGFAGLKGFSSKCFEIPYVMFSIEACLYFLASLTLRECWHAVLLSQTLALARHRIRDFENHEKHRKNQS